MDNQSLLVKLFAETRLSGHGGRGTLMVGFFSVGMSGIGQALLVKIISACFENVGDFSS
jgi:hypothetical protein